MQTQQQAAAQQHVFALVQASVQQRALAASVHNEAKSICVGYGGFSRYNMQCIVDELEDAGVQCTDCGNLYEDTHVDTVLALQYNNESVRLYTVYEA
jgi:hypothetical protein